MFVLWWWYFDGALGASEQPVRTQRDAVRFHIWSYAHFPLYLGIVIAGVGIQRIVTAASRASLTTHESLILATGAGGVMIAMTTIGAMSAGRTTSGRSIVVHVGVALAVVGAGVLTEISAPVGMIALVAATCSLQLAVSIGWRTPQQAG